MESAKDAAASVTERVSDFFQGNPFSTPIGRKIEMATDATMLVTENWGLNMEICDFINSSADEGRDALRAIRKRLHTQMSKNNAIVMYTLTVLETCVKNCDIRFHELVCQKDFISELVKLIGPKFDSPQIIQEKVLNLIKSWNDAFRCDPRLQGVCQVYEELKTKGVEFPVTDLDSVALILTPKRCLELHHFVKPSQPINPTPQQLEKLRTELDIVNGNFKVFREMLSDLVPAKENLEDLQLLNELQVVCKQMQSRILDLIRCIQNEEVTYELLILNDDFNTVFEKFDRYMLYRASSAGEDNKIEINLIEMDEQSISAKLDTLKTSERTKITRVEASSDVDTCKSLSISEREATEMADWLEAQEGKKGLLNDIKSCKPDVYLPNQINKPEISGMQLKKFA